MPEPDGLTSPVPSAAELRALLKTKLPAYMVPSTFVFLDAIPLTANGKVDRRALPAPGAKVEAIDASSTPIGYLEKRIATIWADVLNVNAVGRDDNFFDLGGTSIHTLRAAHAGRDGGLRMSPEMIFRFQTVAELAAALERGDALGDEDSEVTKAAAAADETIARSAMPESYGRRAIPSPDASLHPSAVADVARGNSVIESLGVYLPERSVSTDEVLRGCRRRVFFPLERMTGIRSRRMVGDGEFSIHLARRALADCLASSKFAPSQIDLLICCNISRYDGPHQMTFEPSTAAILRHEFGLGNALAFDISNACAGLFTGIHIADTLLRSGTIRSAALVSGECISHLTTTAQLELSGFLDSRLACLTLGDAGVALTLESSPDESVGLHALDLYTIGLHSGLCIAKLTTEPHGGAIMFTDAVRQTSVGVSNATMCATHVLERGGWEPESFDHVIMHQTSETALREAMAAINRWYGRKVCNDENTIINIVDRGNTATTTHFVAVADAVRGGRIASGDKVVFGISGSGQTIGTALYTFDDLPDRLRRSQRTVEASPSQGKPPAAGRKPRLRRAPAVRIQGVGLCEDAVAAGGAIPAAVRAAEDCLIRSGVDRETIGLLIHAGVYRDEYLCEPAIAAIVAGELKINHDIKSPGEPRTLALDVANGATGALNACYIASEMISAGRYARALVVASEIENNARVRPLLRRGVRQVGSAILLEATSGAKSSSGFGNFVFRYASEHLDAVVAHTRYEQGDTYLFVHEDREVARLYVECAVPAVHELLDVEGLRLSDIDVVFPPQSSGALIDTFAAELGMKRESFVDVTSNVREDLFTSSFPYALRAAWDGRLVRSGQIGLIVGVGSGLQAACALYYF